MHYLYLAIAICAEVVATSALKATDGLTKLWPTVIMIAGYAVAFIGLSLTVKTMNLGIAYAIWAGVGIVLISIVGWVLYKQALDAPALVGMGLIISGVVVINLFSKSVTH